LLARAEKLRAELVGRGWNIGRSESQIIPVVLGRAELAVAAAAALRERGLFVPAVRPPTVAEGEACLRISLSCGHTPEMIDALVECLNELDQIPRRTRPEK